MPKHDELDGCAIDFTEHAISDDEAEKLLIAEGDEEDELDDEGEAATPESPDRGIATRLRKGSLILGGGTKPLFPVRETEGWKNRGRDLVNPPASSPFNGRGSVNHHTAGPPRTSGNSPSLRICIEGTPTLNGPLCHVLQAFDDTAIVVAAGVANHAGSGGFQGLTGNPSVYGLEVEHPGNFKVSARRELVMASIHACFLWRPSAPDIAPKFTCQHREWSTAGKIDFATNFSTNADANRFRQLVAQQLAKLNVVSLWSVSFLDASKERKTQNSRQPQSWVDGHMPAMRRGKVIFTPKRG